MLPTAPKPTTAARLQAIGRRARAALRHPAVGTLAVQALIVIAQLGTDVALARLLGPERLGIVVVGFGVAGLLSVVLLFGTGEIAIQQLASLRDGALRGDAAARRDGRAVLTASAGILAAGSVVAFGAAELIGLAVAEDSTTRWAIRGAIAVLTLNGLSSVLAQVIVGWDLSGKDVRPTVASRLVLISGAVAAGAQGSLLGVFVAYGAAAGLQVAFRARVVARAAGGLSPVWDRAIARDLWVRGRRIGLGSVFGTLANRADALVLQALAGPMVVGLYGAAYRVVTGAQTGAQAVALALYPGTARALHSGTRTRESVLFVQAPLVLSVGLVGLALFGAEPLVDLLFGSEFAASVPIIRVLLVAAAFESAQAFLTKALVLRGGEGALPVIQAMTATTNLTLLAAFVGRHGALAAAWSTLAASIVGATLLTIALRRASRAGLPPAHGVAHAA